MISLNYPSSYATATNALSVPPTVLTSRNGDTLPRTFIKEPSAVELVEAFKTTTDSNALVINKLHSLTYDAVATLQSLRDSNITHHLTAFEEILRSYAIFLGKTCYATRPDGGQQSPSSQGSPIDVIQPPSGTTTRRKTEQDIIGCQHERDNGGCTCGIVSPPSFSWPATEDEGCNSQSSEPITPQNILRHQQPRRSSETVVPSYQCPQSYSVSQQDAGFPRINTAGFSQDSDTTFRPKPVLPTIVEPINQGMLSSVLHIDHATSVEPINQGMLGLSTSPAGPQKPASSFVSHSLSNSNMSTELFPSYPSWHSPPAPSTILNCDTPSSSSLLIDPLRVEDTSFLHDDDDLTWKGLERAIFDVNNQDANDCLDIGMPTQEPEPSDPHSSLDNRQLFSGLSSKGPLVSETIPFNHQSFRPFSNSPLPLLESNGLATAAYDSNLAHAVNVPQSYPSDRSHSLGSDCVRSDTSSYSQSSLIFHSDHSSSNSGAGSLGHILDAPLPLPNNYLISCQYGVHNFSNSGAGSLGHILNAPLPLPNNSLIACQQSTAVFMHDDARRHILAPKAIRAFAGPSFLDDFPPPQLSPDLPNPPSLDTVGDIYDENRLSCQHGGHNPSKSGAGSLAHILNAPLPLPDNSFIACQQSTSVFMHDDARRHILASKAIRAFVGPSVLDDFPPPQLSPDLPNPPSLDTVRNIYDENLLSCQHGGHNPSKSGAGSLGRILNAPLPSPDNSFISCQQSCSTAVFMDDDARRHILVPKAVRAFARPSFLDDLLPPQLSPDFLDRLSLDTVRNIYQEMVPILCCPSQPNILILVEAVFKHVVSTDDVPPIIELLSFIFRFWRDEHPVFSGWGTSTTGSEWIEFTSNSLVTRIRQEFRRIAKLTEMSFPAKVAPIIKFILHLQDLPSVARRALQSLRTLVDAVLDGDEATQRSGCLVAERINFLVGYFSPSMKGEIVRSWESTWQTVRSAALSFIYGKLRSFVCLFIESSGHETHDSTRVLFLARFLRRLASKKILDKVLPIKKLVALLKPPDRLATHGTKNLHHLKAAATLLLSVCSNPGDSGCIACSKQKPGRWKERACACTAYLNSTNYDFGTVKSLIQGGWLQEGFKALLEMSSRSMSMKSLRRQITLKGLFVGMENPTEDSIEGRANI